MEGSIVKIHGFLVFLWLSWLPVTSFFQVGDASGGGNSFISLVFESNSWSRMPTTLMCGFGFHQRDFTSFSLLGRITHAFYFARFDIAFVSRALVSLPPFYRPFPHSCAPLSLSLLTRFKVCFYTTTLQHFNVSTKPNQFPALPPFP